jgi:hypothetical protein
MTPIQHCHYPSSRTAIVHAGGSPAFGYQPHAARRVAASCSSTYVIIWPPGLQVPTRAPAVDWTVCAGANAAAAFCAVQERALRAHCGQAVHVGIHTHIIRHCLNDVLLLLDELGRAKRAKCRDALRMLR